MIEILAYFWALVKCLFGVSSTPMVRGALLLLLLCGFLIGLFVGLFVCFITRHCFR